MDRVIGVSGTKRKIQTPPTIGEGVRNPAIFRLDQNLPMEGQVFKGRNPVRLNVDFRNIGLGLAADDLRGLRAFLAAFCLSWLGCQQ
jgi:hypothetical protein